VVLVGGIHDLVGDTTGSSRANEPPRQHAHSLQRVNGVADRCRDLAWLVDVPGEAADIVALTNRQHQHLSM
jgi:hypothetical protein